MNVRRRMNKHQARLLAWISDGRVEIRWDGESDAYVSRNRWNLRFPFSGWSVFARRSQHKPRSLAGCNDLKAFVVLLQRGWIALASDGRVVVAGAARRKYERQTPIAEEARIVTMSRTRAARVQAAEEAARTRP